MRPDEPRRNLWPIATVVSLLAAVAGWTAVVVLVLTRPVASATTSTSAPPTAAADLPGASAADTSSHVVPSLEAVLPTSAQGFPLTTTSWLGGAILSTDDWSASLKAYLAAHELSPDDLQIAQAYDASGSLDLAAVAFQAKTLTGAGLSAALIAAWRTSYPGLQTSTITLADKTVTKGIFPEESIASYWYASGATAFEIDTSSVSVAQDVLGSLP